MGKRDNSKLSSHVRQALLKATCLDPKKIVVRVNDGWVLLEGSVPAKWDKERAEVLVRTLPSVTGVTNNLNVVLTSRRR
jgi:osmotically-inducible protein OsmY